MMKKINAILLNLVLLLSLTTLVFAEDQVVINNDAIVLADADGAQVRLLQLEERVDVQTQNAQGIIERIKSENPEFDVTRLEEIVLELDTLKLEISNFDLEQDASILAEKFVELKSRAIALSNEFKEMNQNALSEQVQEQLREQNKDNVQNRLAMKNEKIEQIKNRYNAKKTEQYMTKFGIEDPEFVEQVRTGEADMNQVKEKLKEKFNKMSQEKKNNLLEEMKNQRETLKNEFREKFPNADQRVGTSLSNSSKLKDENNTKRGMN